MSESWLDESWEEGMHGDAIKQVDLVNLVFTIHSVELREYNDKDGKPGSAYMARIQLAGTVEQCDAWLGGVGVMPQIRSMVERKAFPIMVKQVTENKAYRLLAVDGTSAVAPAPSAPHATGQWGCRDCRKVNPSENVKCWGCGRERGSPPEPEPEEIVFE